MSDSAHIKSKNPHWNRDELILGLDLYFRLSYGQMDGKNPEVQELSRLLTLMNKSRGFGRTKGSVSLKLANFKRFDPACKSAGMPGGGKLEEPIWNEFSANKPGLRKAAAEIKKEIQKIMTSHSVTVFSEINDKVKTRNAGPPPGPMMESLRDLGYSTETAVADIIDNAIFARANTIRIDFLWNEKTSRITFTDNGLGMTEDQLAEAMRPGNQSPASERDSKDLGRFGLGLKTASLSQCRMFTVLSRKKNEPLAWWRWDLDYVTLKGEWTILGMAEPNDIEQANGMEQGTMVVWDRLDRIVEMDKEKYDEDHFYMIADKVKRHIEMVFHRYLETGKLKILFNGNPVQPWDPFLRGEIATQPLGEETLGNSGIKVRPYILPHRSKLPAAKWEENEKRGGGWDTMQGFYIYRNERLLLAADWLGLTRKRSNYKLARIMIDLPNHFDQEWQIDIKKSRARPPLRLRQQLKNILMNTVSQAEEVFRHRGKLVQRSLKEDFVFVWNEMEKDGGYYFRINRQHPLIASILGESQDNKKEIEKLLRLLEETVPAAAIIAQESKHPDNLIKPYGNSKDAVVLSLMKDLYTGWRKEGLSADLIRNRLKMMEPFSDYTELIEKI